MAPTQPEVSIAKANPSKSFFIAMLTRDIDLADCILDLLDNSVDGIGEAARREGRQLPQDRPFDGYVVDIRFDRHSFSIIDRSGGIPVTIAEEYAFRFGRPDDSPAAPDGSIGIYGIGMKRAIFKMGNAVRIVSSTGENSFKLDLDVDHWRRDPQVENGGDAESVEWSFELTDVRRHGTDVPVGTSIEIAQLNEGIWRQFENPAFLNRLSRSIARDYAFILARGLSVTVNGDNVRGVMPAFRRSAELSPFMHVEEVEGVRIEITAGIADPPPDDTSASRAPDSAIYGWYVVCNDRVVVNADKSADTGWGVRPVPAWHPQFIGFMGVARFDSKHPEKLPWKTTKRDVESSNAFYQRALPVMMRATKRLTDYTNDRRAEAKRLKKLETAASAVPVARISSSSPPKLPQTTVKGVVVIEYVREASDVSAAAEALGLLGSSPSEVGIATFEYYLQREVAR